MVKTAGEIKEAQQGIGKETKGLKNTLRRFSALVSVSLERSIETADTMRARGFKKAGGIIRLIGSKRRTVCSFSYSLCFLCFRLRRSRAARLILCITISCGY